MLMKSGPKGRFLWAPSHRVPRPQLAAPARVPRTPSDLCPPLRFAFLQAVVLLRHHCVCRGPCRFSVTERAGSRWRSFLQWCGWVISMPSRPVRARGLKRSLSSPCIARLSRARAGAWIETFRQPLARGPHRSRPVRARGLKTVQQQAVPAVQQGSRPVRARGLKRAKRPACPVQGWSRPVRARGLKHEVGHGRIGLDTSRPVRARGLKRQALRPLLLLPRSRPVRARGLKLCWVQCATHRAPSRPVRARGLKLTRTRRAPNALKSRPVRARGLKRQIVVGCPESVQVAPRAGAWIETLPATELAGPSTSRPVRARGLKHDYFADMVPTITSRPVRARGLKHAYCGTAGRAAHVAPVRARGLKPGPQLLCPFVYVAPRAGAWIETISRPISRGRNWSPRAGAWIETCRFCADRRDRGGRAPCGRVD